MLVQQRPTLLNLDNLTCCIDSFGHHVARCYTILDDVERSLVSIKHVVSKIFQHFRLLFSSGLNNNVAFVWPCTEFNIVEGVNAHQADFAGICNLFFILALKLQYDERIKFSNSQRRKLKHKRSFFKQRGKESLQLAVIPG